jgi:hypothetical protein
MGLPERAAASPGRPVAVLAGRRGSKVHHRSLSQASIQAAKSR